MSGGTGVSGSTESGHRTGTGPGIDSVTGGTGRGTTAPGRGPAVQARSWLAGPRAARLIGAACALAGVALLVIGLITLRGGPGQPPGAVGPTASSPATPSGGPTPSGTPTPRPTTTSSTGTPAVPSRTVSPPAPAPRAPLTVLNNSARPGLAQQAEARFEAAGWPVVLIGNFAGRIPTTTVYYTPGDAAQQLAANTLATRFPSIHRVLPRYAGLPPTPPGLVVVLTRDWTP